MSPLPVFFEQIKQHIIDWVHAQDDVRAVILTGSTARQHQSVDNSYPA